MPQKTPPKHLGSENTSFQIHHTSKMATTPMETKYDSNVEIRPQFIQSQFGNELRHQFGN